jgi:hypothetical protein
MIEETSDKAACRDNRGEINARSDLHTVQHVEQIFSREIA